jgi:Ca2+-binding EF-hand superfamily protein
MKIQSARHILMVMTLTAAIGAGPQTVWAQDSISGTDQQSRFIERFDQNGDGLVSSDEFPGQDDLFSRLDSDGDGYIAASEAQQRPPHGGPRNGDILAKFDADADGQLSAEEFPGPAEHFTDLDTDGNGYLSDQELQAGRPAPPPGSGIEQDDADQDGKVSQAEFSGPTELFSRLDTDGDGYISQDDVPPGRRPGGAMGDESRE